MRLNIEHRSQNNKSNSRTTVRCGGKGQLGESVEAKVRFAVVGPPAVIDAEGSTAAQPTRHKRSNK